VPSRKGPRASKLIFRLAHRTQSFVQGKRPARSGAAQDRETAINNAERDLQVVVETQHSAQWRRFIEHRIDHRQRLPARSEVQSGVMGSPAIEVHEMFGDYAPRLQLGPD
jgi:hypothetical protein